MPTLPKLKYHEKQRALWDCKSRFVVVPAGRRSGKTMLAIMKAAFEARRSPDGWIVLAAPTQDQAKRIFWKDKLNIKNIFDKVEIDRVFESSPPTVRLKNGCEISVLGMDKPERIEGRALNGVVLDEYGNMKEEAWTVNVSGSIATLQPKGARETWVWFIGVPEGRNHYWDLYRHALKDGSGDWSAFTWPSADILDPKEIASAKSRMDTLSFQQEFEASFVSFVGRAYYAFTVEAHCRPLEYDPRKPLIFCFDFNISPGVAAICQEQHHTVKGKDGREEEISFTAVIGEVWIPRDSNTPRVCARLVQDWGHHKGEVLCYGDATGGSGGTAKILGSDWELIEQHLLPTFGHELTIMVPRHSGNPRQRDRVNAMNSRLKAADGTIRMYVDHDKASHVVDDLEGVRLLQGGTGELDKGKRSEESQLTHISDGLGYYVNAEFPVVENAFVSQAI